MATISGVITNTLQTEVGQSKAGKEFKKQTVVLETPGQYAKTVALEVWNANTDILAIGENVVLSYEPESREYNSKFYTTLKCFKVEKTGATPITQTSLQPTLPPVSTFSEDKSDDLPF